MRRLEWHYASSGKVADLYDMNDGYRMGCVNERPNGDCIVLLHKPEGWTVLNPEQRLTFKAAKNLLYTYVRLE
jgi:hypothetical protein